MNVWHAVMVFVLCGVVVAAGASQISFPHSTTATRKPAQDVTETKGVIAQMFEWTWDSIGDECQAFLGPAGYAYVQTSPPQEHVEGDQWWTDYQPVSYTLTSKRGNRQQFANMVTKCHAAGVKVIADTLFNHMSAMDSGKGSGGSYIAATDLADITRRFAGKPYITQEVIYGEGEPIQPTEYTGIGDVQEFRYTYMVKDAFSKSGISNLQNLNDKGWVDGSVANVFVANHDTERNGGGLNYKASSNTYILATIFSLAHPYGTPSLLSSYDFSDQDAGGPNGGAGTCSASGGANGWLCQHRWTAFTGMVWFRNVVGKEALGNWASSGSQQIAFGRGSKGFVAINNGDSSWTMKFSTSLPAGTYCDVIHGTSAPGKCENPVYTVADDGTFSATVPARDAVALHIGAMPSSGAVHQRRETPDDQQLDRYGGEVDVTLPPDSRRPAPTSVYRL
ncbi:glycoside hydrolase [Gloeophyllum trabeum ATCC 11539]|uniref:alpha-amylase n=1 Tax=Gloeophyllum trabeum (strain ATCC 11539 / FP-39264 / Madison 617) TaxID=670483 RepID=S7Q062_GLOTA|nr:glycoside hydrolase [Gloeophyllum trabeum ATCC 11539]EPQ53316.1 glycoside hydrolase [Gloeophyllum trabeum ATCC 11539]